jgi:hypothetical protein
MPLLFLHIRNGANLIRDLEGASFPDLASARAEAIASARELMCQSILSHGRLGIERRFEITNDIGEVEIVVPFHDALE